MGDLLERLLADPAPPGGAVDGGGELLHLLEFDGFRLESFRRVATASTRTGISSTRVDRADPLPFAPSTRPFAAAACSTSARRRPPDDTQADRFARARANCASRLVRRVRSACSVAGSPAWSPSPPQGQQGEWKQAGGDAMASTSSGAHAEPRPTRRGDPAERGARAPRPRARCAPRSLGPRAATERRRLGTLEFHDLLVFARASRRHPSRDPRRSCTGATSGCCSTSSRTPTRSSSRSPCGWRAAPDDPAQDGRLDRPPAAPGPPVHRRRPEAVDLPVPARRHRPVPARRRPDRRRAGGAERQLPLRRAGDRMGQPRLRQPDHRAGRRPTALPTARPRAGRTTCRTARSASSASSRTTISPTSARTPRSCAGARRPTPPTRWRPRSTSGGSWSTTTPHDLRECRPGDITILLPARTSLAALEARH